MKHQPLQLIIFRGDDVEIAPYEEALVRALQGGKDAGSYLATGDDLGIQLRLFSNAPKFSPAESLSGFCHTVVLVFIDRTLIKKASKKFWNWIRKYYREVQASSDRCTLVPFALEEQSARAFTEKAGDLQYAQVVIASSFGEPAVRPAIAALNALHHCRMQLSNSIGTIANNPATNLTLFISHAKADGLPLAQALLHQIAALGLTTFYDAKDIPAGSFWPEELERGVGNSVIIILRTNIYESRPWCQQEVKWADEYATPAVLVDARTSLTYGATTLPLDRAPSVRIPDGNLFRILFVALRESLRFMLFVVRVTQMKRNGDLSEDCEVKAFSFQPSMAALLRACNSLATSAAPQKMIIYPDPPLRAGLYEAANALVNEAAPGTKLVTPETISAMGA